MKHPYHFGNASHTAAQEAELLKTMIADLNRAVQIFEFDRAAEEERSQISDPKNAEYPMLARTIVARRDNIVATIDVLETRLASVESTATTEVAKTHNLALRRPRRNASPRRFEAWLRLRKSLESEFNPA
jgi:septation ring formation regulator EzrA